MEMDRGIIIDGMPITNAKIAAMRDLISALGPLTTTTDFEELIQMESIRAVTRLWWSGSDLAAFAYVDDYNNLWFDIDPALDSDALGSEIVAWGVECMRRRSLDAGEEMSLDSCSSPKLTAHIRHLEVNGFERQSTLSLNYFRSLSDPITTYPLPDGFTCRAAAGESEAQALVDLQHAAFGTENMTLERRLAIMRAPDYVADLDLVVTAPDGRLAAFCVCMQRDDQTDEAYTEPIGVHPAFRSLGLGKAILALALKSLHDRGIKMARLGTSSENLSMQHLAEALGFVKEEGKLWFSLSI
jgi:mycothiol synthase